MTGSSLPAITPPETAPRVPTAARRAPALALRLSERKALLFASDMLASTAALLLVLHLRFQAPVSWATLARAPGWFVLLAGLWTAFALLLDAYDLRRASRVGSGAGVGMA
ncbi:MAG: hypothetical protein QN162_13940, partial [Armatimonadota bacterium]|nr:hypothetical protein [Armatimonadota bacterium]